MTITKELVESKVPEKKSSAIKILYPILGLSDYILDDYSFSEFEQTRSIVFSGNVISAGKGTFASCYQLTNIVNLPSISSMTDNMYENCFSLSNIILPDNIFSLGDNTFKLCHNISSVIGNYVNEIGKNSFENCINLNNIVFPNLVTLDDYALSGIKNLIQVHFDNVTHIGSRAFAGTNLISAEFNSASSVGLYPFGDWNLDQQCSAIEYISFPSLRTFDNNIIRSNQSLHTLNLSAVRNISAASISIANLCSLTSLNLESLEYCKTTDILLYNLPKISTLYIPNLRYIEDNYTLGQNLVALTSVYAKNLIDLNNDFFYNCNNLISIFVDNDILHSISEGQMIANVSESEIKWMASQVTVLEAEYLTFIPALPSIQQLKRINLPSIAEISGFSNCTNLTSVSFGSALTSIGQRSVYDGINSPAFVNCENLSSIHIEPNSIKWIGRHCENRDFVFKNSAEYYRQLTDGNLVFQIADCIFGTLYPEILDSDYFDDQVYTVGCFGLNRTQLTSISLPNLKYANTDAFSNNSKLQNLNLPNVIQLGDHICYGNENLISVNTDKVEVIGSGCFSTCKSLKELNLSSAVSVVGEVQLDNNFICDCGSLSSLDIRNLKYGFDNYSNSFMKLTNCSSLVSVNADSLTAIPFDMFYDCTQTLQNVNLNSIEIVNEYQFYADGHGATAEFISLQSIEINNTKTIKNEAFLYCESLVNIKCNNVSSIGNNAFDSCISLQRIDIPHIKNLGDQVFAFADSLLSIVMDQLEDVPQITEDTFVEMNEQYKIYVNSDIYDQLYQDQKWKKLIDSRHVETI